MNFASDNWAGVSEPVLRAFSEEARRFGEPYGGDAVVHRAAAGLSALFEREVAAFLVSTGTAANALALSALARPGGVVFAHRAAHAASEECGAPEFFAPGMKVVGLEGRRAKLAAETLRTAVAEFSAAAMKRGQPVAVSISQLTEHGAAYTAAEIRALADVAHAAGLAVHMDGARFANAVAGLGCAPADITWRSGVDVLSFGGTKNGCAGVEAVIFFDAAAAREFPFLRKRSGHLLSKARLSGAQLLAYLEGGHWLALADHANGMAKRLADRLAGRTGVRLPHRPDGNELLAYFQEGLAAGLRARGAVFHDWPAWSFDPTERPLGGEPIARLVTTFEVDAFIDLF